MNLNKISQSQKDNYASCLPQHFESNKSSSYKPFLERNLPVNILDVNIDSFQGFQFLSDVNRINGNQEGGCQARKDRRIKKNRDKKHNSRRTQNVDEYEDDINEEIEFQNVYSAQEHDTSDNESNRMMRLDQQHQIDHDLNEALFNGKPLQGRAKKGFEQPETQKMQKQPGQGFYYHGEIQRPINEISSFNFDSRGDPMQGSQQHTENVRLKQQQDQRNPKKVGNISNSSSQDQESLMINNLKEIQIKKKQQQQQWQLMQLARLIEEQKQLEQQKDDTQNKNRGQMNNNASLEIIEEQATQSSKENTMGNKTGKSGITDKHSNSKKKLSMVKRKLQKAKEEGKTIKFMMRRSNSQKATNAKNSQDQSFSQSEIKKKNDSINNSIIKLQHQAQQRRSNNVSILMNESKIEYSNNTNSFLADSSNLKHSQSQSRFNPRDSSYKRNTAADSQHASSQQLLNNNSSLNLVIGNSLNPNFSGSQSGQGFKTTQTRPESTKKKQRSKPNQNPKLNEESPYNSQYQMRILHDFFDLDCYPVGIRKEGIPLIKVKKINRQSSQGKLDNVQAILNHSTSQQQFQKSLLQSQNENTISEIYSVKYKKPRTKDENFNQYDHQRNQSFVQHQMTDNSYTPSQDRGSSVPPRQKTNIINTNHNQYVCFGVNIIKSDS